MKNPNGPRESRLDRIEVLLETSIHEHALRFGNVVQMQADTWSAINGLTADVKDLAVDRAETWRAIDSLREFQKATEEKLNILVDTVDRIIRRDGKDRA